MSTYFVKGKGWRYDFTLKGIRYTEAWFKTNRAAQQAEAQRKEDIANPKPVPPPEAQKTPTGMGFLELVNKGMDYVKAHASDEYYRTYRYLAKRCIGQWGQLSCEEITEGMVEDYILKRREVSSYTANKDLRYLKAMFNFGMKKKLILLDPTDGMESLPVEKKLKRLPTTEDIDKVIEAADPDTQDYLWTIRETMGRVGEINRLTWADVRFEQRCVILYTRKKRGGHLTPRTIAMTEKLFDVLSNRYERADRTKHWVFWHRYWSKKEKQFKEGPYKDRKKIMRTLCKNAGVEYFRFHPLRHAGASLMDGNNVPISAIQRILGHESRRTTEIYLHSIGDMERNAMAVFERARKKSHTDSHTAEKAQKKRIRRGHLTLIKY